MKNTNNVIFGKDDWLFLGEGTNDFMSYVRGNKKLSTAITNNWINLLLTRKKWFHATGIKYIHVFAPEKATVYPEFLLENVNQNLGHISVLSQRNPDVFLNVLPYFRSIKNKHQLYSKTDTHWNYFGAFACYQLICSILGYEFNTDIVNGENKFIKVLYDLGGKLTPPQYENIQTLKKKLKSERSFSNLLIRYKEKNSIENEVGLHVGSRVIFNNNKAMHQEKVIIFGDSFSEYRLGRLTEMFAETFSEVHFCWSASIDYNYIKRIKPNIVITELCERFAVMVPNDEFNVDSFARNRLKKYLMK